MDGGEALFLRWVGSGVCMFLRVGIAFFTYFDEHN